MFDYNQLQTFLELDLATFPDRPPQTDDSVERTRAVMLRRSFFKKLSPDGTLTESQIAKATEKFLASNNRIADQFVFSSETSIDDYWWDYFRDHIDKTLCSCEADYSLDSLRDGFATGPGAAIGADSESFYTKVTGSKLTATSEYLLTLYRGILSESDTWSEAEKQRFKEFGFQQVSGNRLFFVPKDVATARSCCTEPSINMMLQKALGAIFEKRLKECFAIDLATQPERNREMARVGSIEGSFGTIDLESASDSISWPLLQTVLRGRVLGLLRLFRSPTTRLPSGEEVELKMVSTMGNGFTFPLMTIILCCAVRATYDVMGLPSNAAKGDFAVFGDDIIVRTCAYDYVVRMLGKIGFRVNEAKSFSVGPFRESCGRDYVSGFYCRGVYIKTLESQANVYSAVNRLTRWSSLSGISLKRTIAYLLSSLGHRVLRVPRSESMDSGLHVPFCLTIPRVDNAYWFAFRKLVPRLKRRELPADEDEARALKYGFFNPNGALLALMGGYARSSDRSITKPVEYDLEGRSLQPYLAKAFFTLREVGSPTHYKVRTASVPWWDWPGAHDCAFTGAGMSQSAWERTMAAILE